MLREPAFPAPELETLKRERATELEESRTDPQQVAARALAPRSNPYPDGDPRYAPTLDEELAWIKARHADDVKKFHAQFYGASNAELAIVGDFDPDAMRALVTELFGAWKSPSAYARVPDPFVPNKPGALKFELADKANAFLIGRVPLPLNDQSPDYPALLVVELSSSASRRRRGSPSGCGRRTACPMAWAASSAAELVRGQQPASASTRSSRRRISTRCAPAIAEEMARALKDGFTEAEVANAKAALMQERRLGRTRTARVAGGLANQAYLGRTWSRPAKIDAAIEKLTPADVNAALRKYLKPDDFAYAFAGDFAKKK